MLIAKFHFFFFFLFNPGIFYNLITWVHCTIEIMVHAIVPLEEGPNPA